MFLVWQSDFSVTDFKINSTTVKIYSLKAYFVKMNFFFDAHCSADKIIPSLEL